VKLNNQWLAAASMLALLGASCGSDKNNTIEPQQTNPFELAKGAWQIQKASCTYNNKHLVDGKIVEKSTNVLFEAEKTKDKENKAGYEEFVRIKSTGNDVENRIITGLPLDGKFEDNVIDESEFKFGKLKQPGNEKQSFKFSGRAVQADCLVSYGIKFEFNPETKIVGLVSAGNFSVSTSTSCEAILAAEAKKANVSADQYLLAVRKDIENRYFTLNYSAAKVGEKDGEKFFETTGYSVEKKDYRLDKINADKINLVSGKCPGHIPGEYVIEMTRIANDQALKDASPTIPAAPARKGAPAGYKPSGKAYSGPTSVKKTAAEMNQAREEMIEKAKKYAQ